MSPEMLPKSFGTFGKRAPGRFSLNNSNGVLNNILGQGGHLADKPGLRVRVVSSWAQLTRTRKSAEGRHVSHVLRPCFYAHELEIRPIVNRSVKPQRSSGHFVEYSYKRFC